MNNWRLVRLNFKTAPAHFGEVGIGLEKSSERVHSDTLFSALINAYVRLFGSEGVNNLLNRFPPLSTQFSNSLNNVSPVQLSSTFIYTYTKQENKEKYRYYLPRPFKHPPNYPDNDLSLFKAYKKLKYLPLDIWERWYQGNGFSDSDRQELEAKIKSKNHQGFLAKAETFNYNKTYKTQTYPKVSIDRITAATNFYHTGFTQFLCQEKDSNFKKRSGLYFLLYFSNKDQQLENSLYAALTLLGEEGLGGERSSGAGRFEIEYWGSLPLDWQKILDFEDIKAKYYCLLSLFWNESLTRDFLHNSSYELIERGGWISSPFSGRQLRRKKVRMFTEGSVFTSQPLGQLADVTPLDFKDHSIYRSGISLSLPIKVKLDKKQGSNYD
jgi:CRISPR-associated protein Csm4